MLQLDGKSVRLHFERSKEAIVVNVVQFKTFSKVNTGTLSQSDDSEGKISTVSCLYLTTSNVSDSNPEKKK